MFKTLFLRPSRNIRVAGLGPRPRRDLHPARQELAAADARPNATTLVAPGAAADALCGAVTTALVNAAWSRGLGCVINSQGIMQSPVVRKHADIPDDQVIMKAVAMGWPDESFPANAVVSERKGVDEAARFVGFD